jgi:hypothetical protein
LKLGGGAALAVSMVSAARGLRSSISDERTGSLSIYIDRVDWSIHIDRMSALLENGRKRSLLILFIPSVERDGQTAIPQDRWVDAALTILGRIFGGATAYPRARGVWRDDDRGGALVLDEPVVVHCYVDPTEVQDDDKLAELREFCCQMGRETNQGEIGVVVDNEYFAIRNFDGGR